MFEAVADRPPVDALAKPVPEQWILHDAEQGRLPAWRQDLLARLSSYGFCLLESDVDGVEAFKATVRALGFSHADQYGDLPNSAVAPLVFETTRYPPEESILFHNEASHTPRAPAYIFFHCHVPAVEGGATPVSDGAQAWARLRPALRSELERRGLTYTRRFLPYFDIGWREFFGTHERERVESHCASHNMEIEWLEDDGLEVRFTTSAVSVHPRFGQVMFHQVALHHPVFLDPPIREYFSGPGMRLPRAVTFGDGSEIPDAWAEEIHAAQMEASYSFPWRAGHIAVLDNRRMAHARAPFVGARKHFVMLSSLLPGQQLWEKESPL